MKIIELEQGSPEWLEFRSTRITATDFSSFMAYKGLCPNLFGSSLHKLISDKVNKVTLKSNKFMERGQELEPIVRDLHNLDTLSNFKPVVLCLDENDRIMASLDGLYKDRILEIKTTSKAYEKWNELILFYKWQLFHQLMVSSGTHGVIRIHDANNVEGKCMINEFNLESFPLDKLGWLSYCNEFLDILDSFKTPEEELIFMKYKDLDKQIKDLENTRSALKEELIRKNPGGITNQWITIDKQVKSSVDYKKYVQDSNLTITPEYIKQNISYVVRVK